MKKLAKLNLEELAKQVSQLEKEEAKSAVGAECYYSADGKYLGVAGDSNDVRITTSMEYNLYKSSPQMLAQSYSSSFTSATQTVQNQVVSDIAYNLMGKMQVSFDGATGGGSGGVVFGADSPSYNTGNLADIICDIGGAIEDSLANPNASLETNMVTRYTAIVNHPYYNQTSSAYRAQIESELEYWERQAGY